jgi:hypothetical protein
MEHIIVDDWDTELSILKLNDICFDKEYEFLGNLQFRLVKGRKIKEKLITE